MNLPMRSKYIYNPGGQRREGMYLSFHMLPSKKAYSGQEGDGQQEGRARNPTAVRTSPDVNDSSALFRGGQGAWSPW